MDGSVTRIVLICGDRAWSTRAPIENFLRTLPDAGRTVVITGGASGADTIAADTATHLGHRSIVMAPPWRHYGKRAGPLRNGWMLDALRLHMNGYPHAQCDVHAFHSDIARSKGTADMLSKARAAGIRYEIHSQEG